MLQPSVAGSRSLLLQDENNVGGRSITVSAFTCTHRPHDPRAIFDDSRLVSGSQLSARGLLGSLSISSPPLTSCPLQRVCFRIISAIALIPRLRRSSSRRPKCLITFKQFQHPGPSQHLCFAEKTSASAWQTSDLQFTTAFYALHPFTLRQLTSDVDGNHLHSDLSLQVPHL